MKNTMHMTVALEAPAQLYRATISLYRIQCYLDKSAGAVDRYLKATHVSGIMSLITPRRQYPPPTRELIEKLRSALQMYVNRIAGGTDLNLAWTKEVVLCFMVVSMEKLHVPFTPLGALFRGARESFELPSLRDDEYDELQSYLDKVDTCSSIEQLRHRKLYEVEHFNSIRQNVVFLTDRNGAKTYTRISDEVELYRFTLFPSVQLRLLNLNDAATARMMMRSGFPFASGATYDDSLYMRYVESSVDAGRTSRLAMLWESYWEEIKPFVEEWESRLAALGSPHDRFQDEVGLSVAFSDEDWPYVEPKNRVVLDARYHGRWRDAVARVAELTGVADLKEQEPEYTWQALHKLWTVYDDMTAGQEQALRAEFQERSRKLLMTFTQHLATAFEGDVPKLTSLVNHFSVSGPQQLTQFYHRLSEHWHDMFAVDIISPRGVWTLSQWFLLFPGMGWDSRSSVYSGDTMMVYELRTSRWLSDKRLNGWRCASPYEVMLIEPQKFGVLKRIGQGYDAEDCVFEEDMS